MGIELTIAIASLLGLIVGLLIGKKGRNERDKRLQELQYENNVKQNVIDSNNDTINRLRRENERLKKKLTNDVDERKEPSED